MLDTKSQIINQSNALAFSLKNTISFENISLILNSRKALSNTSFVIEANKTTAIVGAFGSGKTSIANLLTRFYDATSGAIYFDNTEIKNIKLQELRKNIALVTQDNIIFDSTIAENIAYGKLDAEIQEIMDAAQKAGMSDFIATLPDGYQTLVGAFGEELSGSQKQLISIARALIKDAEILILDESTSALDQHSEKTISDSIKFLRKNKTNIIIAHRLNSISYADKIIVMNNGHVVEEGTQEELLQKRGYYYMLYS